jgi:hypothetical protein
MRLYAQRDVALSFSCYRITQTYTFLVGLYPPRTPTTMTEHGCGWNGYGTMLPATGRSARAFSVTTTGRASAIVFVTSTRQRIVLVASRRRILVQRRRGVLVTTMTNKTARDMIHRMWTVRRTTTVSRRKTTCPFPPRYQSYPIKPAGSSQDLGISNLLLICPTRSASHGLCMRESLVLLRQVPDPTTLRQSIRARARPEPEIGLALPEMLPHAFVPGDMRLLRGHSPEAKDL